MKLSTALVAVAIVVALATATFAATKRRAKAPAKRGTVPSWTHATRWSSVKDPKAGKPRVIGGYASGCVVGATELPDTGPGFEVLHRGRHRYFGHPDLVAFVRRLAGAATARGFPPLLVGDLSQPRGGPTPTDHGSHQSGLDVDISYTRPPDAQGRALPPEIREALVFPVVFDLAKAKLTPNWHPRIGELLELAATDAAVDRIFVNASIKRTLCETRRGPWLQTMRPWWGHHDHFHVRLKCPSGSPACKGQPALPAGDGCNQLGWWFRKKVKPPVPTRKPPAPELPQACRAVLN